MRSETPAGTPRRIRHGEVELAAETFGAPDDPAALLIMGATASMLWWPAPFCEALAATGLYVIRFDNRDTGQSRVWPAGPPPYSIDDMAEDAVAILDAYEIPKAHLIGLSLGGMIAQIVALSRPDRVLSLTAISSSAVGADDPDLPPIDPGFMAHFARLETLDWDDPEAVIAFQTESARLSAGGDPRFDPAEAADLARREFDRARSPRSAMNHGQLSGGDDWTGRQGEIAVPSLVIHGARDPIISEEAGRRLAASLPSSRLVLLSGGHELNRADWPRIIAEISTTIAAAGAPRPA